MKKTKTAVSIVLAACLLSTSLMTSMASASVLPVSSPSGYSAAISGTITPTKLTVETHINPIGMDIAQPNLAWMLDTNGTSQAQTAYRILASSTPEKLANNEGDMWDTGKVESDKSYCNLYQGTPLASRQRVYWKVMVWDASNKSSNWSETAFWEAGLLDESEWKGSWIGKSISYKNIITNDFTATTARYVRMKVTGVGPETFVEKRSRLQFMEWEICSSENQGVNIAAGKKATATNALAVEGAWSAANLTDGSTADGSGGYSSNFLSGTDISANPVYVTIDLGEEMTFDQFKIHARTAADSIDGNVCPNYPKQYEIQISNDGTTFIPYTQVDVSDDQVPTIVSSQQLPLFAKDFTVQSKEDVASARLYISGLGMYEAHVNGKNVADTVFDPGETDFKDTVLYATYDVTNLITDGGNAIGIMLGNGMYNVGSTPGRYQKHDYTLGEVKTIAQLELTMKDGSVQRVATDGTWDQTNGPIVFGGWYGGEDYDATQEVANWDIAGTDRSGWSAASPVEPAPGKLTARNHPPLRVKEELTPKSVTKLANGNYMVDMGRNFAGVFEMKLTGLSTDDRGTKMQMWPAELLKKDGSADQGATGSPIYDSYIIKGDTSESFRPRFTYHGFRYLEVTNAPVALTVDNFRGYMIRTDNAKSGSFETSSDVLNKIDGIVTASVESNMYSTLTDCPHREKLGWLEVSHLMYYSMAYTFDIQSWMKKITMDMTESQLENGMMPSIAPEYAVFGGGFRSDPTWGGAAILDPWYTYQVYGDDSLLATAYPMMSKYIDYIKSQSKDNLVDFGLGDWGAYDTSTPVGLVVSATYYNLVDVMSQIAEKLNKPEDVASYKQLAADIKTSFNKKYYNPTTGQYGSGSQSSNACPLFADLVPQDQVNRVVDNLVANIESRGWHLSTGEVGLRQMFVVLGKYGRSDVVYKMATNKTMPSYWYFIENDRTSLPEFWDMNASQNHCMMGHIQEWFYRYLAGIDHSSPGFKNIVIKPFVPGDLETVKASTMTSYGRITSEWTNDLTTGALSMNVDIPVGTTADIYVPALGRSSSTAVINGEKVTGTLEDDYILFTGLGSGSYTIQRDPAVTVSLTAKTDKSTIEIGEIAEYAKLAGDAQITTIATTDEGDSIVLSPASVSYSVDNPEVASVDIATGKVTGLADGTAIITISKGDQTATATVTVNTSKVVSLAVTPSKSALNYVGDEVRFNVTGKINTGTDINLTGYKDITMTNQNTDIASLRVSGTMVLNSRGTVGDSIKVSAQMGNIISPESSVLNGEAVNLARDGSTVRTSSSTLDTPWGTYPAESAVNSDKTGKTWGSASGGWSDGTPGAMPDWYQVDFNGKKTISAIDIYNLQDNFSKAENPTLDSKFTQYGMAKYTLQYWDGINWLNLPNGSVSGNNNVWTQHGFDPITTSRVRVLFNGNEHQSRLVEIEVWEAPNELPNCAIPLLINNKEYTNIATKTWIDGTYSISVDNQKLLSAVTEYTTKGESATISLSTSDTCDRMILEMDSSLLTALKDQDVTISLTNKILSVEAPIDLLCNQGLISEITTATSPTVVSLTINKGADDATAQIGYTNFDATKTVDLTLTQQKTNKNILEFVIDYAQKAIDDGRVDALVPTAQANFMMAFHNATTTYNDIYATQDEANQAWALLMDAIHTLSFVAGDKTDLNALIAVCDVYDVNDIDGDTTAFTTALATAKEVSADPDAMDSDVKKVYDALNEAVKNLIFKDRTQLKAVIGYADTRMDIIDLYQDGTEKTAFIDALSVAKSVLADKKTSQAQIDEASKALIKATANLRFIADKATLETVLNNAKQIDLSVYTTASVTALEDALQEGQKVFDDPNATEEQIADAANRVLKAQSGLVLKMVMPDSTPVDKIDVTADDANTTTNSATTGDKTTLPIAIVAGLGAIMVAGIALKKRTN